jgi:hypothetical protein
VGVKQFLSQYFKRLYIACNSRLAETSQEDIRLVPGEGQRVGLAAIVCNRDTQRQPGAAPQPQPQPALPRAQKASNKGDNMETEFQFSLYSTLQCENQIGVSPIDIFQC